MNSHSGLLRSVSPSQADGVGGKRQRISRACDRCRRKKVKCDGRRPICTHCEAIGTSCTYLDTTKKRGPPKGYIDAIECRLHAAEGLLRDLVHNDSKAARFVVDALQAPGGDGVTGIIDSSGKVFGTMTMSELEDRASGSAQDSVASPTSGKDNAHPMNPAHGTADTSTAPSISALSGSNQSDVDCTGRLTHMETGVGHLTLDQTGSLRYLGDSSGWYIINRSLLTSETSSRFTKSADGPLRWPPITTNACRDYESTDAGPATASTIDSTNRNPAISIGNDEAILHGLETNCTLGSGSNISRVQAIDGQPRAVSIPQNMPPCGKPPMPDIDEQIRLLSLYFRYVHPVFPILYKSYFIGRAFDREKKPILALMSAVFAAASTYKAREARDKDDLARVRIQMAVHFQRAKLHLDEQYTQNTVASILTLLLMSVYEQGTMSTRSWLYSGMAIRKAYDLGLHRGVGISRSKTPTLLSQTDTEIRQRAWWGCYIMDIMVSATLGRPTTIRDFTFDAPYPSDYGEDRDELLVHSSTPADTLARFTARLPEWVQQRARKVSPEDHGPGDAHRPAETGQGSGTTSAVADRMRDYAAFAIGESESEGSEVESGADGTHSGRSSSNRKRHERKALGVYYLELLHVLGHVLTEMYTCKPHRSYITRYCVQDLHSRTDRLITLDHELRQWKASLPPALQYPVDDIIAMRPARCVYIALIHLVYYTAMILLHRPFISRLGDAAQSPDQENIAQMNNEDRESGRGQFNEGRGQQEPDTAAGSPLPSHTICTVSAQIISLIGQAIVQDSRIFIMPFLTFILFTAGAMHLNNVIVAADSWIARRFLKRTLDAMSRLGAHWQVSYKCYTMLNTLVRANRIGLEQIIDDSEAGIRLIKERSREIARVAHAVYESRKAHGRRSQQGEFETVQAQPWKHEQLQQREASGETTATASKQPKAPANEERAAEVTSRKNIFKGIDEPQPTPAQPRPDYKHGQYAYGDGTDRRDTEELSAGSAPNPSERLGWSGKNIFAVSGDGLEGARTVSPIGTKIFGLRNSLDVNGRPIVPASPYTSVDLSGQDSQAALLAHSQGYEARSIAAGTAAAAFTYTDTLGKQTLTGATSVLGQFVPSLEFFANADFPLGIGGPNGQASTVLPRAMSSMVNGRGVSDIGGASQAAGAGMAGTSATLLDMISRADIASGLYSGNAGTGDQTRAATMAWESLGMGNMVGMPMTLAASMSDSELTPAQLGLSGVLIDDDVIRNLPFTGPISFDLGGATGPIEQQGPQSNQSQTQNKNNWQGGYN
ncbi:hypothetical protein H4R24_001658 [Coemansia sp. RSA 988]|nr:hypothetical protein H4R24_001658 [Coemansia sp. RSA 988]